MHSSYVLMTKGTEDMGQYSFVLLDADETLFDFARCEREALTNVFLAQGVQLSEEMILWSTE